MSFHIAVIIQGGWRQDSGSALNILVNGNRDGHITDLIILTKEPLICQQLCLLLCLFGIICTLSGVHSKGFSDLFAIDHFGRPAPPSSRGQ